jgi:hypothetical protein
MPRLGTVRPGRRRPAHTRHSSWRRYPARGMFGAGGSRNTRASCGHSASSTSIEATIRPFFFRARVALERSVLVAIALPMQVEIVARDHEPEPLSLSLPSDTRADGKS